MVSTCLGYRLGFETEFETEFDRQIVVDSWAVASYVRDFWGCNWSELLNGAEVQRSLSESTIFNDHKTWTPASINEEPFNS